MGMEGIKQSLHGEWRSIAPELRPSTLKSADGVIKPFYLARVFRYATDDTFELEITNFADPYGNTPLVSMIIKGHVAWQGDHPIAADAHKVHFIADMAYDVTPLAQGFADLLNQVASTGFNRWELNRTQSILRKHFAPFGLAEGQTFGEYDLIYIYDTMLFWGARHVDGRGFDTEDNRPTNLQIPLVRA